MNKTSLASFFAFLGISTAAHAQEPASEPAAAGAEPSTSTSTQTPTSIPEPLPAPSPPRRTLRFGDAGEFVFSGASSLGLSSTSYDTGGTSTSSAGLDLALDYFVLRGLSLGVELAATRTSQGNSQSTTTTTGYGAGLRLGYAIALNDAWSFWPQVELSYASHGTSTTYSTTVPGLPYPANASGVHGFYLGAYAPLILSPAPHFFVGLGPYAQGPVGTTQEQQSYRMYDPVSYGAMFTVGGFLGGEEHDSSSSTETRSVERFGDPGTFVIAADTVLAASHQSDSVESYSLTQVSVAPSVDYFIARDISLGLEMSLATVSSTQPYPALTTNGVALSESYTSVTYGAAARFGVNVPLGTSASWWFRGAMGASSGNIKYEVGPDQESYGTTAVWTKLDAPVLVHFSHAFVGLGPSVYHELSRTGSAGIPEATTLGLALTVGGWL